MLVSLMAATVQRSTHDVLYAAIIARSAAIVGGVIGGAIPGYFTLKAQAGLQGEESFVASMVLDTTGSTRFVPVCVPDGCLRRRFVA
jgi:hypothetical protein